MELHSLQYFRMPFRYPSTFQRRQFLQESILHHLLRDDSRLEGQEARPEELLNYRGYSHSVLEDPVMVTSIGKIDLQGRPLQKVVSLAWTDYSIFELQDHLYLATAIQWLEMARDVCLIY